MSESQSIPSGILHGRPRAPRQMLADQSYDGHASVHDGDTAASLGLSGAPIEGPTHFSQYDPFGNILWGQDWYENGCLSSHFRTMVVEGEEVVPTARRLTATSAAIESIKIDGTPVLAGTISVGRDDQTALEERLARAGDPGDLFIVDTLTVGQTCTSDAVVSVDMDTANGNLYPFSLRQKLDGITEMTPWYESGDNPWGRPILPLEMLSVLAAKAPSDFVVRGPSLGLFLDLEVRVLDTPVFVDQGYRVEREVVGLGQSRRTESYWVRSTLIDAETGAPAAEVLLHSGVFKDSYADYPSVDA